MVPQHGQGAVGEAARTVMVTSLVILTCSRTRSERSGMMVIGSHRIGKTSRRWICLVLQYNTCGISEPAEEPYPVREFYSPLQLSLCESSSWYCGLVGQDIRHLAEIRVV